MDQLKQLIVPVVAYPFPVKIGDLVETPDGPMLRPCKSVTPVLDRQQREMEIENAIQLASYSIFRGPQ